MSEKPKSFLDTIGWTESFDLSDKPGLARVLGLALFALALVAAAIAVLVIGHFLLILITGSEGTPNPRDVEIRNIGLVAAAVLSVPFVIWRSVVAQQQADTAQQSLITTQITNAVEGLGAEKVVKVLERGSDGSSRVVERSEPNIEVRVGAILSLERISDKSPEDHIRIMEILCTYIRENACTVPIKGDPEKPDGLKHRTDTQMALTVIGRRSVGKIALEMDSDYRVDLRSADLRLSDLGKGAFQNSLLQSASLEKADLRGVNLEGSKLWATNLKDAELMKANLKEAKLGDADLRGAKLWGANVRYAKLWGANLENINLAGAILEGADFWGANLDEHSLKGAQTDGANLDGAIIKSVDRKD